MLTPCFTGYPDETERTIIAKAQRGDAAAFEFLYLTHRRRILYLCHRIIKDWSIAEDLTQDTFLRVFRKLRTFRFESAFSTWIHRIAINVALMHLRHQNAVGLKPALELDAAEDAELGARLRKN